MGYEKNKQIEFTYEFSVAKDGGAQGEYVLKPVGNPLVPGLIVNDYFIVVTEPFATEAESPPEFLLGLKEESGFFQFDWTAGEVTKTVNFNNANYLIETEDETQIVVTINNEDMSAGAIKIQLLCYRA